MAIEGTIAWPMIMHLDNKDNIGPKSVERKIKNGEGEEKKPATINENHARELMELHTVSPKAGYTQEDVHGTCMYNDGLETESGQKKLIKGQT